MKFAKALVLTALGFLCCLGLLLFIASRGASNTNTSTNTPTPIDIPSPDTASVPYTYTTQDAVYSGASVSQVGVAILNVSSGPWLYTDTGPRRADGGSFISVGVAVSNFQHSEITMDGSLFHLLDDQGNDYSYSDASLSIPNNFFLAGINPGVSKIGTVAFDVPADVTRRSLRLRFRGGITGETVELPLEVQKKLLVQPIPQPTSPSPLNSATQQDTQTGTDQPTKQPENEQTPATSENPATDQPQAPMQPNM